MLVDLRPQGAWEQINSDVAKHLRLPDGEMARVGLNLGTLVMEAAVGFFHQYSHRPQVALIKGNSPILDPIHAYLLKEAVAVQVFQAQELSEIVDLIPQLKADLCFFAYVEDHPVTGELLKGVHAWPQALNAAKIPFLRISHHAHRLRKSMQEPCLGFEFRIGSWGSRGAVARHGSRWKSVPAIFHPWLSWNSKEFCQFLLPSDENEALIRDFERQLLQTQSPARLWFSTETPRVFDRLVLDLDVHGELFIEELAKDLGQPLQSAGFEKHFETAALTRWESFHAYSSWWKLDRDLAGVVVLSASLLQRKDFFSIFTHCLRRVESMSRLQSSGK